MKTMNYYERYIQSMQEALNGMIVTNLSGEILDSEAAFDWWRKCTVELRTKDRTCYFIGNGASATMASHMAVDATKNAGIKAMTFNDAAFLTAIGNDIGYEEVFSLPLKRFAHEGDLLVTISSSGNSPNVLRGIECARETKVQVITLSGMKPDNKSRRMGDLNFYVPAATYGFAESAHAILLHCWLDHMVSLK
jgi:D-sedoheptulose 7-phosphate isomerase